MGYKVKNDRIRFIRAVRGRRYSCGMYGDQISFNQAIEDSNFCIQHGLPPNAFLSGRPKHDQFLRIKQYDLFMKSDHTGVIHTTTQKDLHAAFIQTQLHSPVTFCPIRNTECDGVGCSPKRCVLNLRKK